MLELLFAAACFVPQDVPHRIESICARSAGVARASVIANSRGGRAIHAIELSAGDTPIESRPGILVVAGADGTRPIDVELALYHCAQLVDDHAAGDENTRALLADTVVWVIPQLNPDGYALGRHGNATELDLDRDGRFDEDPPQDLDGDGWISWMRWEDPDGEWVIDADEPRLMRKAKRDEGERPTHSLAIEARDADGDDARGEDDAQGVWIDRTLPHRWDEFDRRTGPFPSSEPATRALLDFVYARRNIVTAFVWGRDDNLLATPKVVKPKPRVQNDGILDGDKGLFERAGKRYRELTDRKGEHAVRFDGSPWGWLYLQIGVPVFASDIWRAPALEDEDAKDDLRLEKRRLAIAGDAFVDWKRFDHPDLGDVEIGGFANVDETTWIEADAREATFAAHHAFLLEASTWRADLRIEALIATPLGDDAFEIEATIVNDGALPALTATGERTRRFSVPRLVLSGADLLAGRDRQRVENLDPHGARKSFRWIVTGAPSTTVALQLTADPIGGETREVTL